MNVIALLFFLITSIMLLSVPRKWAPVPLLVGCCYMTMGQGIEIGPASLPVYRMLLAAGVLRVFLRGEHAVGWANTMDKLMLFWAAWVMFASFFHEFAPGSGPIYSAGMVFNILVSYYLIRVFCRDLEELRDIIKIIAVLLVPIALSMIVEKLTAHNPFVVFGGIRETVLARNGALRAQGPFRHPILAGTVGATCVPLMIGIYRRYPVHALIGLVACMAIVVTSRSSGPLMSLMVGLGALVMWNYRHLTKAARWAAVLGYLALALVMNRPVYYLMGEIDLTGGSTGWHRARLIEKSFEYISEWWLFGTDYTRHWMPNQGIAWSEKHTDITSYYIGFGVLGGLLAMILIIAVLWRAFMWVGDSVRRAAPQDRFMAWCLGAGLFAHAATSVSVAYFDQSLVFFWLNVAVISSFRTRVVMTPLARSVQSLPPQPAPFEGYGLGGQPARPRA